jgi:hypothetical protein
MLLYSRANVGTIVQFNSWQYKIRGVPLNGLAERDVKKSEIAWKICWPIILNISFGREVATQSTVSLSFSRTTKLTILFSVPIERIYQER